MSSINEHNCFSDSEKLNWDQTICIAQGCMACRSGKWEETHRIFVL
jgi:hypothetical protein